MRRQMDAAERLLHEVEPDRVYPIDFIIFRITSFRPESSQPDLLPGGALIEDLAKFIERLSDAAALGVDEYAPRAALLMDEVGQRLNVSPTTLHRYRKQGLVAHQVVWPDGKKRLAVFKDALDRFVSAKSDRVRRAKEFSRVSDESVDRMHRRARRYADMGLSLNEAALRIARRFNRSHETVRQILMRRRASSPGDILFEDPQPLSDRDRAVILRAADFGAPVNLLVKRFKRSRSSIYRTIYEERLARLNGWAWNWIELPTFEIDGADQIILSPASVRTGFDPDATLGGDAEEWIAGARSTAPPSEDDELAWFAARHFLLNRADAERRSLAADRPRGLTLDRIETRLRWASRLQLRIIHAFRGPILRALEIEVGGLLLNEAPHEIAGLHTLAMTTARDAAREFDPRREQRFETYLIFSLRRALARRPQTATGRRARRISQTSLYLRDFGWDLDPWQRILEPPPRLRRNLPHLTPERRQVLIRRYGWAGDAPATLVEVGAALGKPPERIAALETEALRELRRPTPPASPG